MASIMENVVMKILTMVRESAINNAGAVSIKGAFEPAVPEQLREKRNENRGGKTRTEREEYVAFLVSACLLLLVCMIVTRM